MIQKNSKSYKFLWHFRFFQHYFWGCRIFELWHCHLVNVSQCFDGTWCLWNTRNQSQTDTMSYLWTPESSYRFCCMKVTLYFKTVTIYVIWFSIHYMYFMYILYFLCFSSKVNVWSYLWVCHEKLWKSGGVAPLFCNLSLTWRWVISFVSPLLCIHGKGPWNLLNGMHCTLRTDLDAMEKFCPYCESNNDPECSPVTIQSDLFHFPFPSLHYDKLYSLPVNCLPILNSFCPPKNVCA